MKFLKIINFLSFLTQIGQKFCPKRPSNVAFLAIFALNFHSSICTTTNFCFKRYSSPCKIWKKLIENACFFTFFTTLDLIWPKFCPKATPTLIFFAGFQWNMLRGSIDINNFNWLESGSSEKVLLKPLKLPFFDPTFAKMESLWATSKIKKTIFFSKITKPDHIKLSKTFLFY